jgi:hypothetical protein
LEQHGFWGDGRHRLRHIATSVQVDLLYGGEPMPRPGAPPYPAPQDVAASSADETVIGLAPLIELKLHARRHQDIADVVALLKLLDDAAYLPIEAQVCVRLRARLSELRRDALEELAWE